MTTKDVIVGDLEMKRLCHGTKKRWHNRITSDLQATGIRDNWYSLAQDRSQWHTFCDKGIRSQCKRSSDYAANNRSSYHLCPCGRRFRRKGDLTRHS